MLSLTPFLLFNGNCAEAMTFYHKCLGGDLVLTKLGDTPMKDQMPGSLHHKIVHAHLACGAIKFSATDWLHPTRVPVQGNMTSMFINGGSYEEIRAIFDKLAEGGDRNLLDDLKQMPLGTYGHLADKYGVHWIFAGERKDL